MCYSKSILSGKGINMNNLYYQYSNDAEEGGGDDDEEDEEYNEMVELTTKSLHKSMENTYKIIKGKQSGDVAVEGSGDVAVDGNKPSFIVDVTMCIMDDNKNVLDKFSLYMTVDQLDNLNVTKYRNTNYYLTDFVIPNEKYNRIILMKELKDIKKKLTEERVMYRDPYNYYNILKYTDIILPKFHYIESLIQSEKIGIFTFSNLMNVYEQQNLGNVIQPNVDTINTFDSLFKGLNMEKQTLILSSIGDYTDSTEIEDFTDPHDIGVLSFGIYIYNNRKGWKYQLKTTIEGILLRIMVELPRNWRMVV